MIIAAVRTAEDLSFALNTTVSALVHIAPNIAEAEQQIRLAHEYQKKIFLHLDLSEGIGKDRYGIRFLRELGADGIISTRTGMIRTAKEEGLFTIQRFFIIDSHSVDTTAETLKSSHADMAEIMPGIVTKTIRRLKHQVKLPLIAGGLIETEEEVRLALQSGAAAVSTGKRELWK